MMDAMEEVYNDVASIEVTVYTWIRVCSRRHRLWEP